MKAAPAQGRPRRPLERDDTGQLAGDFPVGERGCDGRRSGRLPLTAKEGETMTMKNPPHPGLTVRHDCLEPLGLSVTEAAKVLGVTRQAMNNLVSGKAGISA